MFIEFKSQYFLHFDNLSVKYILKKFIKELKIPKNIRSIF
jgi:hypothetical protein